MREREKTVRDETRCQSAKINRWIKPGADVSLLTVPLLCFHLLLQVSLHLTPPESLKNADKQRLGSIFICTWSSEKKHPATFFSTLCLSRSLGKFCCVVNGTLVLITWSRGTLWPRSSLLQLCSLSQRLIFFVSWCVHVLQFCSFYCILKSLIIIPSIDYILVINAFAFDLCNEDQSDVYWFIKVEEIFIPWPVKKKSCLLGL